MQNGSLKDLIRRYFMPYTYEWEKNGVYRKFTGIISGEEILNSNFELQSDIRFSKIKYVINDFTAVTGHSIENRHTKAYAKNDDVISISVGKLKIAIIVIEKSLISLAELYKKEMKELLYDCEIFETIGEARNWVSSE